MKKKIFLTKLLAEWVDFLPKECSCFYALAFFNKTFGITNEGRRYPPNLNMNPAFEQFELICLHKKYYKRGFLEYSMQDF